MAKRKRVNGYLARKRPRLAYARAGPAAVVALAALRGERKESKFHDVDLDDAVVDAAGSVTASVCLIAQGVTESTRVGRKCTLTSIGWKFDMTLPVSSSSTGTSSDHCRVIMYEDKQANGATAAVLDILESANYQSFNNLTNSGRFRTLCDQEFDLNYIAGAGDGATNDWAETVTSGSFYKKVNIPLEFSAGTGAITEIRSSNIGVLLISRSGVTGFNSKIRLRFSG